LIDANWPAIMRLHFNESLNQAAVNAIIAGERRRYWRGYSADPKSPRARILDRRPD
jgi:hypothetical protein